MKPDIESIEQTAKPAALPRHLSHHPGKVLFVDMGGARPPLELSGLRRRIWRCIRALRGRSEFFRPPLALSTELVADCEAPGRCRVYMSLPIRLERRVYGSAGGAAGEGQQASPGGFALEATARHHISRMVFACWRSRVSKPSLNQP